MTIEEAISRARAQAAAHLATNRANFRRDLLANGAGEPELAALMAEIETAQAAWLEGSFLPAVARALTEATSRG